MFLPCRRGRRRSRRCGSGGRIRTLGELLGDGQHRGSEAVVVAVQEAEDGGEQIRGVERVGVVVLAQHAAVADPSGEDVVADLVRRLPPARGKVDVARDLGQLRRPVQRHPAHELRRHVVLRGASRLPDPLVRLLPRVGGALGLSLHDRPEIPWKAGAAPSVQQDRVEHRPVDVVLPLVERCRCRRGRAGRRRSRSGRLSSSRSGRGRPSMPYMICSACCPGSARGRRRTA